MTFAPPLQADESIRFDLAVQQPGRTPLRLLLTNRAAYWPAFGSRAVRAPIDQIRLIEVREARHIVLALIVAALVLATLLVIFLAVGTLSLLVTILAVSFLGLRTSLEKPRLTIVVQSVEGRYSWTEPADASNALAAEARTAVANLHTWATAFRVPFIDRRKP